MTQTQTEIVLVLMQISGTIIAILAGFLISRIVEIISQKDVYYYQEKMISEKVRILEDNIDENKKLLEKNDAYNFLYENFSMILQEIPLDKMVIQNNFTKVDFKNLEIYYKEYLDCIKEAKEYINKSKEYIEDSLDFNEFLVSTGKTMDKESIKYDVFNIFFFINYGHLKIPYGEISDGYIPLRFNSLTEEAKNKLNEKCFNLEVDLKILRSELDKVENALKQLKKIKDTRWGFLWYIVMIILGLVVPLISITMGLKCFICCIVLFCIEIVVAIVYFKVLLKKLKK